MKHRRAEVECMHAMKEPTGGEMCSYIWWWVTLFWDFTCTAHRIWRWGGSRRARPLVIGPLLGCCENLKQEKEAETGVMRYSRPVQQQCVDAFSNINTRLDHSRIDSRINRAPSERQSAMILVSEIPEQNITSIFSQVHVFMQKLDAS